MVLYQNQKLNYHKNDLDIPLLRKFNNICAKLHKSTSKTVLVKISPSIIITITK